MKYRRWSRKENASSKGPNRPWLSSRRSALLLCLQLSFALVAGPSEGQRTQPTDSFADQVTVFEIEVPVQVFRDGEPVKGLTQEDFSIVYKGETREIVSFVVSDVSIDLPGRARNAPSGNSSESAPSDSTAETLPAASASRALLLLFDFEFQARGLIARSIAGARESLSSSVHSSDRIAVAILGGRQGARILTGFTRDRKRTHLALDLVKAIADAKPKRQRDAIAQLRAGAPSSAAGLSEEYGVTASVAFGEGLDSIGLFTRPSVGLQGALTASQAFGTGLRFDSGQAEVFGIGQRLASFEKYRNTAEYAEALGNLATILSGVEGQKYAVLFSQGPPLASMISTAGQGAEEGSTRVAKAMARAFGQMVRAGWQIHALGQGHSAAAGFNEALAIDYDIGASGGLTVDAVPGSTGPSGGPIAPNYSHGGNSLWFMAQGTGGKAYLNANLPAVDQFLNRTSVTYILRFLLPEVGRNVGKERFQVRLADNSLGFDLQYRNFFYPPKLRSDMNDIEMRMADARDRIREQSQRASRNLEFATHAFLDPEEHGTAWLTVHLPASQLVRTFESMSRPSSAVRLSVVAGLEKGGPAGEVVLDQSLQLDSAAFTHPPADGLTFVAQFEVSAEDAPNTLDLRVAVELGPVGATMKTRLQRWASVRPSDSGVVGPFFLSPGLERVIVRGTDRTGAPVSLPLRAQSGAELVPLPFVEVTVGEQVGIMLWTQQDSPVPVDGALGVRIVPYKVEGPAALILEFGLQRRGNVGSQVLWFAPLDTTTLSPGVYRMEGRDFDNPGVGFFRVLPARQ